MKEKPPTLNDEELREQIALEVHDWHCPDEKGVVETYWTGPSMQDYLECADVILPYIQQARKPKTRIIDITRAKKKVRQDTAREIFEDVERLWPIPQPLKDKWLKAEK